MKFGMDSRRAGCLEGDAVPFPGALPPPAASFLAGRLCPFLLNSVSASRLPCAPPLLHFWRGLPFLLVFQARTLPRVLCPTPPARSFLLALCSTRSSVGLIISPFSVFFFSPVPLPAPSFALSACRFGRLPAEGLRTSGAGHRRPPFPRALPHAGPADSALAEAGRETRPRRAGGGEPAGVRGAGLSQPGSRRRA